MLISDYKPFKKKNLIFLCVCETFNRINKQEGKKKERKKQEKVETK